MLTEKDYCDYETCVALEEVGMLLKTQIVRSYAKEGIQTSKIYPNPPSLYEAQKWLREEKHLHIEVRWYSNLWYEYEVKEAEGNVIAEGCAFPTYEEALSTAVRMAVECLKENKYGKGSNTCQ